MIDRNKMYNLLKMLIYKLNTFNQSISIIENSYRGMFLSFSIPWALIIYDEDKTYINFCGILVEPIAHVDKGM